MEVVRQEPHLPKDIAASWMPFSTLPSLRVLEGRNRRFNLLALRDTFHYIESTLKRDHLFSLLGLALDANQQEFVPAYGYTDFASMACRYGQGFVRQGHGIRILRQAGLAGRSVSEQSRFPSWLPDFTRRSRNRLLNLHDRGMVYDASKGVDEDIHFHPGNYWLKRWIKYFADIDDILVAVYGDTEPERNHQLKVHVPIAGALSGGGIGIEESYATFFQGLKKARFRTAKQLELRTARASMSEPTDITHKRAMTNQDKGRQYESLLRRDIEGWRFIVTRRKHCGIAPNGIKIGDRVCTVGGGDVPFILRKIPDDVEYQLVAGCYVHGMMNGESLNFSNVEETYLFLS
ncbi:hypothetical protein DE146DRAFT_778741 [Phaeosphaeria sp. MPI-PUGE-AT-0046c]|nr:hypothetical protein DE146DRAFT_778741 [Phaeosphaeria sp. MPI-PUGE-AT-0046c]